MRSFVAILLFVTGLQAVSETLYNGIELPTPWPPADSAPTREPMTVPYLKSPPPLVPIDIGRQLFVDDFLIESTDLNRTFYTATYYPNNPVLGPDKEWEQSEPSPTAMVFSDGVWYDPQDKLFKMWYMGAYSGVTCYAESTDGLHWDKPVLDIKPGTNIVNTLTRDSGTVWLDLLEKDPARRYKMFQFLRPEDSGKYAIYFSADGKHWGDKVASSGPTGDRSTVFYNPFRNVWVYSIRADAAGLGRCRRYRENSDPIEAAKWKDGEPIFWLGADTLDAPRPEINAPCELYNLDAVAYESLMIGLLSIWRGQPNDRPKPNQICIGFSRDGFHWQRPSHDAFIPVSEHNGDWNWGNVQSAGGCCLIVGDKLYFYVSGRKGIEGKPTSGVCSTGLATLRRDGFASMDAGVTEGTLTTRPLTFKGKYLFVNADAKSGGVRVEVLDADSKPIDGFTADACTPVSTDTTKIRVEWKSANDLSARANKPVRFRFHVREAKLFAFWVSPEKEGASHGYVAAGGPGFDGLEDKPGK